MAFRIEIAPRAVADLDAITEYIREHSSLEQTERWFNAIMRAIRSLGEFPERCPVMADAGELGQEVRVLLHGRTNRRYRVYFTVNKETSKSGSLRVLHIRHWGRRAMDVEGFEQILEND